LVDEQAEQAPATPEAFRFHGSFLSLWAPEAAARIGLDATNIIPYVLPPEDLFSHDLYVWDAWPVRLADGEIASFDGWTVMVGLSAARSSDSDYPFYTRSTWRYWFSKDGNWQLGGEVFSREAGLGSRQWAGSSVFDPETGRVTFYYTAVGGLDAPSLEADQPTLAFPADHPAHGRPSTVQRMAAVSAVVSAGAQGVAFDDFDDHRLLLEADGRYYQTQEQSIADQVIYGMRDPWYYRAPDSETAYLLFTANAAFAPGEYNGVVGIAREQADGSFELLPPILGAPGVSSQLERPHLVRRGDRLYLLFSTHAFTFADGFAGPEGLYGFVSETGDIAGPWLPLNGSGLVAGNPAVAGTMLYSYLALQDGWVTSYLNTAGGELTEEAAGEFFGGPAPLFRIGFDGARTAILDIAAER
jgi:levansucrase